MLFACSLLGSRRLIWIENFSQPRFTMKITLILTGKNKEKYVEQALEDYRKRICRYVPFNIVEVPSPKVSKKLSVGEVQEAEARSIRKALPENARLVLLDERGRQQKSEEFARWMQKQMASGVQNLVFVIGGAYGFSPGMKQNAYALLSLSKMTLSHQVIRIVFAEQLYRAFTILKGEPYHHGG